jgi:uncharacterized protein (TIGR00661 family)
MARIVYGVLGQGLGHATRAHTIGAALLARGHEVHFVSSDQATRYLAVHFPERVHDIFGLRIEFRRSRVATLATIRANVRRALRELPATNRKIQRLLRILRPELVMTDFEPFTAFWARRRGVPFIGLDNEHLLTHCRVERLAGHKFSRFQAYVTTRLMMSGARRYLITYFVPLPIVHQPAVVVPPVLRPEVYALTPRAGDYLLVYLSEGLDADALCRTLESWTTAPIRAYVAGRSGEEDHLSYRPRSLHGFLDDLAGCRGVLTSAGYSLMCECLHLRKPMLIVPAAGQYEQELNAHYMERWGYGMTAAAPTPEVLTAFWTRADALAARMSAAPRADVRRVIDLIEAEL